MGFKSRAPGASGKKFMFLTFGFEKPTQEDMAAWGRFFESLGDRILDQGGFWSGGFEFTAKGEKALPFGKKSITGYIVFSATDIDEAKSIASGCPVVASNRVYEIMSK